ncbi:MAG: hypothetical protein EOS85_27395 [Mesorhizobium sp.]|nr:MAG: hypothetical protein EOS85_27395 [Mesorhizobium sp.]
MRALAKVGADVAIGSLLASPQSGVLPNQIVYLPSDSELAEARAELEALGVRSYASDLDLCSDESVEAFFTAAAVASARSISSSMRPAPGETSRSVIPMPTGIA